MCPSLPFLRASACVGLVVGLACDSSPKASPTQQSSVAPAPSGSLAPATPTFAAQTPTTTERMRNHAADALAMRQAVVRGQLERLASLGNWVARDDWSPQLKEQWRVGLEAMQKAARGAQQASSVPAAAQALGELGAACGRCHEGSGVVAKAPPSVPTTWKHEMEQHRWATERLWEGLSGPSDEAWQAGANLLATAPLVASDAPEVQALAERLHERARAARSAAASERPAAFGDFLSSCAPCHGLLHVQIAD